MFYLNFRTVSINQRIEVLSFKFFVNGYNHFIKRNNCKIFTLFSAESPISFFEIQNLSIALCLVSCLADT